MAVFGQLVQLGINAIQSGRAKDKRRIAEADLENLNKSDKSNQSILDYYNKALAKYSPNPFNSQTYTEQSKNVQRGLAQGLADAQSRRSGLAAVGSLVQGSDDALLKAAGQAERQQSQDLSQLGVATQMKSAEDRRVFDNKYNLLAMKAGQSAQEQTMKDQATLNSVGNMFSLGTAALSGGDWLQKAKFYNGYGNQSEGAYNYAKENNLNYKQYKKQGNQVGRSLLNYSSYFH